MEYAFLSIFPNNEIKGLLNVSLFFIHCLLIMAVYSLDELWIL